MKATRCVCLLWLAGAVGGLAADAPDLAHYQVVIDKNPFGAVAAAEGALPPNWSGNFVFCGLVNVQDTDNVLAIIQDTAKNRVNFCAPEDLVDKDDIVKLLSIDTEPPRIVLQRGLEKATLEYRETSPKGAVPMPGVQPPGGTSSLGPRRIPFRRPGG